MEKTLEDKTFFISHPSFEEVEILFDYGCANGALIKKLAEDYPDKIFLGYDSDEEMRERARDNIEGLKNCFILNREDEFNPLFESRKTGLLLSSVLHEIDVNSSFRTFFSDGHFGKKNFIYIRDMWYNREEEDRCGSTEIVNKVYKNADLAQVREFLEKFGKLEREKNLLHFLLKYRYKENWERELEEDYFNSMNFFEFNNGYITNFMGRRVEVRYQHSYLLPFLLSEWEKDFGIDGAILPSTHINLILEVS